MRQAGSVSARSIRWVGPPPGPVDTLFILPDSSREGPLAVGFPYGRGRVVLRARADAAGVATLDVRGLTPGLYLVREDGGAGRRLVVE